MIATTSPLKVLLFMLMINGDVQVKEMPTWSACEEAAARFTMLTLSSKAKAFCITEDKGLRA